MDMTDLLDAADSSRESWRLEPKMVTEHLHVRDRIDRNDKVEGSCRRQQRDATQNERVWQVVDRMEAEFVL